MSRYYFNVAGSSYGHDNEGSELPSLECARAEALLLASEIIRDGAHGDALDDRLHIEVTDADGLILFLLDFVITATPATARPAKPN